MSEEKSSSIGTMIVVAIAAGLIGYVIGKPAPPQVQAKASETPEKPSEAEKPAESGEPANLGRSAGQNKPTKPVKQSGYQAGPTIVALAGARTVRVSFFKNKTLEPRLVVAVNRALKRNLQQDGTFELETSGNADFLVTGELTDFLRNGVSYTPGDTLTVQDYNLQLTAKIKVTVRVTGKVILDREITGSSIVRVGNDLTAGQRQAVPLIADQLARQATDLIVDVENKKANDQQSGLTKITNEPEENAATEGTVEITNLTPIRMPRNNTDFYPVEMCWESNQTALRRETVKPVVLVGTNAFPMKRTQLLTNRWETLVPIGMKANELRYRIKVDWKTEAIPIPHNRSTTSSPFRLTIAD